MLGTKVVFDKIRFLIQLAGSQEYLDRTEERVGLLWFKRNRDQLQIHILKSRIDHLETDVSALQAEVEALKEKK